MELIDAKGYRSKYINALNAEARRIRVIGGDVIPEESDAGTLLKIDRAYRQERFDLFKGLAVLDEKSGLLTDTLCVSDGSLFVNGELIKLKNATNTKYLSKGVSPRPSGWVSKGAPSKGSSGNVWTNCDVVILKYSGLYYFAFRYDNMELHKLISEDATADIEDSIEVFLTIGSFSSDGSIKQSVNSDVFITAGTAEEKPKSLQPWQVIQRDGVLYVVNPIWTLSRPYEDYPVNANRPMPEYMMDFKSTYGVQPVEIEGVQCFPLESIAPNVKEDGYTHIYACMSLYGGVGVLGIQATKSKQTETPVNALIAIIGRDSVSGDILGIEQIRQGEISSSWTQTEPFYATFSSSETVRYSEAPIGLPEGTEMERWTFWMMRTNINRQLFMESEKLNYRDDAGFNYPNRALLFGSYIWRFNLHYNSVQQALIIDTDTTPVIKCEVSQFAKIIPQPFVERIQVVYPNTPIEQGSVDAMGGTINVLAVNVPQLTPTTLFKTETIHTKDGDIIEAQ